MRPYLLPLLAIALAQEERLIPYQTGSSALQVSGQVIDAQTGEALMGVRVKIGTTGTYTNERGFFWLQFTKPESLEVFLLGYQPIKVFISRSMEGLTLRLSPIQTEIESIPIIAEAERETEAGVFLEKAALLRNR
ncbi:MAG: carboxypeptidase-like regulatory domain-containing protein [Bacteroidia bacterium]|nr:carboxypeptidase-like regulatory domain-containing protein [Bacteroidia bacterium]MDW8133640.1 carboxypeptidase-like regulatory domain-containing protein [Bacteroidia bacterium]